MRLDEIMDKPLPFKVLDSSNRRFVATFEAGGRRIDFQADYEDEGNWVMGFGEPQADGSEAYGKTGSGKEFEVFSTVNAIIKRFIKERDPKGIRFTADHADGNRASLYTKMAKKNVPPGWKLDIQSEDDSGWGEDDDGMTFFMLTRK